MRKLTQKEFRQENIINIIANMFIILLTSYYMSRLQILLVTVVSVIWILVSLGTIVISLRTLTNKIILKRKFIERNDERYRLIKDKADKATYTVLAFVICFSYSLSAGLYALDGREFSVSIIVVSIILLAISVSTNQIARWIYSRIL